MSQSETSQGNLASGPTSQVSADKVGMGQLGDSRFELELRLADVAGVLHSAGVDEDTGELAEDAGGLLSALDYAVRGDPGCMEPDEWEARRQRSLTERREYLGLTPPKPPVGADDEHTASGASMKGRPGKFYDAFMRDQLAATRERARLRRRPYACPNCGHYLGDHIGTTGPCTKCLCQSPSRGRSGGSDA